MDEHYWIKKQIDFEKVDEASSGDIVSIKNSTNIEAEFIYYSEKFQFAADKVANHLLVVASESNDIGKLDTWFFAVMYLYRQSLELILKTTLLKYVEDSVQKSEVLREARHDLQKCFELILNNQPSGQILSTVDCLNWIEAFLSNISSLDKQSDMFRYPFNQNMESFFEEQTHINLYATKNNLNIAYNILRDFSNKGCSYNESFRSYPPKLIINGGNYYEQSVVGYKFSQNDFYPYIKGYEEAANLLRDLIINDGFSDLLFLPMCYLYRNAVELSLKRILIEDCKLPYIDALAIINKKKHKILGLWKSIKTEVVEHANTPEDDTTVSDAEAYITQLHNIDPDSSKFRYPVTMDLKFHFLKEKRYSIRNISSRFNELIAFLDAVDSMLAQIREWEAEMEAEYREDFSDDY